MAIDNKPNAGRIKFLYLLVPFIFTIIIALTIFFEFFETYNYLIVLAVLFILIIIFLNKLKFRYIMLDIKDNKLILRYHGLGPMGTSFKSIEFPAQNLAKYEIRSAFYGLRKELVLYQRTNKGIAKYPGVSLAAVDKLDREKIVALLANVLKLQHN